MMRSDEFDDDDRLTRVITRQIAEAAPPAPSWASVRDQAACQQPDEGYEWRRVLLAAAVVVGVVAGLWFVDRSPAEPQQPADVPTWSLPTISAATWAAWTADADAATAHSCHASTAARLTLNSGVLAFADREGDAGYTPERARHAAFRSAIASLGAALAADELAWYTRSDFERVVAAWRRADAGYYGGPESAQSEDFAADVAATEEAFAEVFADPMPGCWFAQGYGADAVNVGMAEAATVLGCVTAGHLWIALGEYPTSDDLLAIDSLQAALVDHVDQLPVDFGAFAAALDVVRTAETPDIERLSGEAQELLEVAWGSASAPCTAIFNERFGP